MWFSTNDTNTACLLYTSMVDAAELKAYINRIVDDMDKAQLAAMEKAPLGLSLIHILYCDFISRRRTELRQERRL